MSADGVTEQFEYMRYPGKWELFFENYQRISKTPFFWGISLTLSSLNAFNIADYLCFWESVGETRIWVGHLHVPELHSVEYLPKFVRNEICRYWLGKKIKSPTMQKTIMELFQKLQQLEERTDTHIFSSLFASMQKHDKYRGNSFEKVFPEYHSLLAKVKCEGR